MSVSDITSLTMEREKRKRKAATKCSREGKKKKAHRKKYFHSYENQRSLFEDRAGSAHFVISFDPPKDGNCQFAAICKLLNSIGIHRSNHTMREDIVNYLNNNPTAADGTPLQNFTDLPWPTYLPSMSQNGTFGDHITLQAASNLCNVAFQVLSSDGPVGGINSGDGDQASVDRQNSGEDDQVSVGGQDCRDCDEACQNRPNDLSLSREPCLNPDILEEIARQTLRLYPYMRSSLKAVSRFFRNIVEREPLPRVYIPELNDVTDIRHVSVRKIIILKGKNSGAVLRLKEIINSALWASAWLSFFALGNGWFSISNIYWKRKSHR